MASSKTAFYKVANWNQIIPQSWPSGSDPDAGRSRSRLQLQAELHLWQARWATSHKGTWPWSTQPLWEEPKYQHNLSKRGRVAKAKHLCFYDIFYQPFQRIWHLSRCWSSKRPSRPEDRESAPNSRCPLPRFPQTSATFVVWAGKLEISHMISHTVHFGYAALFMRCKPLKWQLTPRTQWQQRWCSSAWSHFLSGC